LLARLAADDRLQLTAGDIDALLARPLSFTGAAASQVAAVVQRIDDLVAAHPEAAQYRPAAIV
jgi:adenylosuccinate lyase